MQFSYPDGDHVTVRVRNTGRGSRRIELANAYQSGGRARAVRVLRGHGELEYRWRTGGQGNWYDVRVTALDGPAFGRRYAGHLENGEVSTSDPGPLGA